MRRSSTKPGSSSCWHMSAMVSRCRPATSAGANRAKRLTARIGASITRSYSITLEGSGRALELSCGGDQYIWDAAAFSGVELPAICHQGRCLTCAGRVIAGEFDQSDADQYYPEDRAAGFILLCR